MLLKIDNKHGNRKIELGDIIKIEGYDSYLVCHIKGLYTLRNLNGKSEFSSGYDTIEDLRKNISEYSYTHYSHRDFVLTLEKIDGGDK